MDASSIGAVMPLTLILLDANVPAGSLYDKVTMMLEWYVQG